MKKTDRAPAYSPLYEQIKGLLTRSLEAGEWKPGEAIPSELELAGRYRVSQGTVRKAIDALAAEHLVTRHQGKGTFVATHSHPAHQLRFLRIVPDSGGGVHPDNVLLGLRRGKASAEVAAALRIRAGTSVHVIHRLLRFEGTPAILDEIVLPAGQFRALTAAKLSRFHGSIYGFYESAYHVRMVRAEERLRAVGADAFAAQHLGIRVGTPLLCVDRIAFTYGDKPVEWRRGLCVTEGFSYFNELS